MCSTLEPLTTGSLTHEALTVEWELHPSEESVRFRYSSVGDANDSYVAFGIQDTSGVQMSNAYYFWTFFATPLIAEGMWTSTDLTTGPPTAVLPANLIAMDTSVCRNVSTNVLVSEVTIPVGPSIQSGQVPLDVEFNVLVARGGNTFSYHGFGASSRQRFPITIERPPCGPQVNNPCLCPSTLEILDDGAITSHASVAVEWELAPNERSVRFRYSTVGEGANSYAAIGLQPLEVSAMADAYYFWTVFDESTVMESSTDDTFTVGMPPSVDSTAFVATDTVVCRQFSTGALVSEVTLPVGTNLTNGEVVLDSEFSLLVAAGGSTFGYHGIGDDNRAAFNITIERPPCGPTAGIACLCPVTFEPLVDGAIDTHPSVTVEWDLSDDETNVRFRYATVGDGTDSWTGIGLRTPGGLQMADAYYFWTVDSNAAIAEGEAPVGSNAGTPLGVGFVNFVGTDTMVCRVYDTGVVVSEVTVPVGDNFAQGEVVIDTEFSLLVARGGASFGYHGAARSAFNVTISRPACGPDAGIPCLCPPLETLDDGTITDHPAVAVEWELRDDENSVRFRYSSVDNGTDTYASIAFQDPSGTQMSDAYYFWTVFGDSVIAEGTRSSDELTGRPTLIDTSNFAATDTLVCRDFTTGRLISEFTVLVGENFTAGEIELGTEFNLLVAAGGSTLGYHGSGTENRAIYPVTIDRPECGPEAGVPCLCEPLEPLVDGNVSSHSTVAVSWDLAEDERTVRFRVESVGSGAGTYVAMGLQDANGVQMLDGYYFWAVYGESVLMEGRGETQVGMPVVTDPAEMVATDAMVCRVFGTESLVTEFSVAIGDDFSVGEVILDEPFRLLVASGDVIFSYHGSSEDNRAIFDVVVERPPCGPGMGVPCLCDDLAVLDDGSITDHPAINIEWELADNEQSVRFRYTSALDGEGTYTAMALQTTSGVRMDNAYFFWTVYSEAVIAEGRWTATGNTGPPTSVASDGFVGMDTLVCRDRDSNVLVSEFSAPVGTDLTGGEVVLDAQFNILVAVGGSSFGYHGGDAEDRATYQVTIARPPCGPSSGVPCVCGALITLDGGFVTSHPSIAIEWALNEPETEVRFRYSTVGNGIGRYAAIAFQDVEGNQMSDAYFFYTTYSDVVVMEAKLDHFWVHRRT